MVAKYVRIWSVWGWILGWLMMGLFKKALTVPENNDFSWPLGGPDNFHVPCAPDLILLSFYSQSSLILIEYFLGTWLIVFTLNHFIICSLHYTYELSATVTFSS